MILLFQTTKSTSLLDLIIVLYVLNGMFLEHLFYIFQSKKISIFKVVISILIGIIFSYYILLHNSDSSHLIFLRV